MWVRGRARGGSGGVARVIITLPGSGIAPEVLEKGFRSFFATKTGGTGLGLAVSRQIMEAHGGTISLASTAGQGTKIMLEFPAGSALAGPVVSKSG